MLLKSVNFLFLVQYTLHIDIMQREDTVNRVSTLFPKVGHLANYIELKIICTHNERSQKQATEDHYNTIPLEWSVINYWDGASIDIATPTLPSVSEIAPNIKLIITFA